MAAPQPPAGTGIRGHPPGCSAVGREKVRSCGAAARDRGDRDNRARDSPAAVSGRPPAEQLPQHWHCPGAAAPRKCWRPRRSAGTQWRGAELLFPMLPPHPPSLSTQPPAPPHTGLCPAPLAPCSTPRAPPAPRSPCPAPASRSPPPSPGTSSPRSALPLRKKPLGHPGWSRSDTCASLRASS